MKNLILLLLFFPLTFYGQQDTIKVMHYNVLNYGNTTSYCTNQNNNIQDKDNALQEIIDYTEPHIFTVNEIGSSNFAQERVLTTVLNIQGRNYYEMADVVNASGGSIDNMIYFDSRLFGLAEQDVISTSIRDIDIYKLFYKDKDLATTQDTAFLTCLVTHLKAGSSASDQQLRASMTATMMNYIENNMDKGNFLLLGDLNLKRSSEQAYQNVINYSNPDYKFYDPIDTPGDWNNTASYANVHTQSTHYSSNGCASGGGLDDRFDFIMISEDIKNNADHYQYVANSYQAMGNDGQHFNDAINYGSNNSVPANVLDALYTMSDHLPIQMNLVVDQLVGVEEQQQSVNITVRNPVKDQVYVNYEQGQVKNVTLYSMMGEMVTDREVTGNRAEINVSSLSKGAYILEVVTKKGQRVRKKIIKI